MTRLIGPSEASREVKTIVATAGVTRDLFKAKRFRPATYYTDLNPTAVPTTGMLTQLANILNLDGTPVTDSTVTIDAYSMLPLIQFPDGADSLLIQVDGGPPWRVYAREDDQIDALEAAVAALQTGVGGAETPAGAQAKVDTHSADTTAVHGIADTTALETQTGAQAKATAAQAAATSAAAADATTKASAAQAAAISAAATDASTKASAAQTAAISTASADATTKANTAQAAAVQRGNHTGTQSADTLTDGTTAKAFLATERTKLAGVASGATANSTDSQLRDRSTHTGTQAVGTITGLGGAATLNVGTTASTVAAGNDSRIVASNVSAAALGIYSPLDPAYGYTSGTDIAASCQAAINAMPSSGAVRAGTLQIPPGNWTFSTAVTLKSGVRVTAASRSATRITGTTAGVFTWTADLNNVTVEHLNLVAGTGHIFAPSGGAANWGWYTSKVQDCNLTVIDVNGSIVNHVSNRDFDNVQFLECDLTRGAGSLVPGFNIVNSAGAANQNTWRDCWAHSSNSTGAPMFYVESTSDQNYAYGNVFENITGEQCAGGLIDLRSNHSAVIKNCYDYDTQVTYTADIIRIGKSAITGGLPSLNCHIENSGRRDNVTLPGSLYDINLVPGGCRNAVVFNGNHSSNSFKVNWSDADGNHIFNLRAATLPAGQPSDVVNVLQTTKVRALYIGSSTTGTAKKTAGTGSPEGVVTGSVGDEYTRTDGTGLDILYLKKSGAATTTGWASTGRPLPPAFTPSGGRRLLSGWPFPSAIGTFSLAKDTWRYSPLSLAKDLSVNFLSVLCSVAPTGGTGTMIFGLWALDASGKPSTRQADWSTYGSIDLTVGAGGESILSTPSLVIPAGDWAIGCAWTGTASTNPTMFATTGTHPSVSSNSIAQQTSAYSQAVSGASPPSPAVPAAAAAQGVAIYGVLT